MSDNVKIPVFAVSLGAVESILSYPAKMSHAAMPERKESKEELQIAYYVLSVGLENPDDLIKDFSEALEVAKQEQFDP